MSSFRNPIIIADNTDISFVNYGIRELCEILDVKYPAMHIWDREPAKNADCVILIGAVAIAGSPASAHIGSDIPGPEGYAVKAARIDGLPYILVAGSDAQGIKYGIIELLKQIRYSGGSFSFPDDFEIVTKPYFTTRGMYAHLHWQYNRPYACRSWSLEDWKCYVDLLSWFGANVLQLWPMLCILSDPLTPGDRAYLEMFNELVEYAHACRGMEVWVGECCNNVASGDVSVEVGKREYFEYEKLLNPGDARELEELISSRRNMYQVINKADGYWIIDSDPGSYKGSPSSDFVRVFSENQALMRKYHISGNARMVYWMHMGWGTGSRMQNLADISDGLARQIQEPWSILLGTFPEHIEAVKQAGLFEKAIYFPYATIEGEPSAPQTQIWFEKTREKIGCALDNGLARAMGQSQTAIVQLPNIYFYLRCLWDPGYRSKRDEDVLEDLARLLYPGASEEVAQAWSSMLNGNSEGAFVSLERLKATARERLDPQKTGACRFFFGSPEIVADDIVMQLPIYANAKAFKERVSNGDTIESIKRVFKEFIKAVLAWREKHGYLALGGTRYIQGDCMTLVADGMRHYDQTRHSNKTHENFGFFFDVELPVKSRLFHEKEYHPGFIQGVITEIREHLG